MRVFVAGATGAIGRRMLPMLVDAGHAVTGTARSDDDAALVRALGAHAAIGGFRLLTRDAARYEAYFPTLALLAP